MAISSTKINDALYQLHHEAEMLHIPYAIWGEYAIRYYILTGRASVDWVKAFLKASPRKLLSRMVTAEAGSDCQAIEITTKYLCRYCGLSL